MPKSNMGTVHMNSSDETNLYMISRSCAWLRSGIEVIAQSDS